MKAATTTFLLATMAASAMSFDLEYDRVFDFPGAVIDPPGLLERFVFAGNTTCAVKFKALPFAVYCNTDFAIFIEGVGPDGFNKGNPLIFSAFAGAMISMDGVDGAPGIDIVYGVETPEIDLNQDWLNAFGINDNIPSRTFPPKGIEIPMGLPVGQANIGLCLVDRIDDLIALLPPTTPELAAIRAAAELITEVAGLTGTDICIRLEGFTADPQNPGAQFKLILSVHFLDEALVNNLTRDLINLIETLLNRELGIVMEIDLGKLIFDTIFRKNGLIAEADAPLIAENVLGRDGTFLLGSFAEPEPEPETPAGDPLPPAGNSDEKPEEANLAVPIAIGAGSVIVVAIASALFVHVRRKRQAQAEMALPSSVVQATNPRYDMPY